MVDPLFSFGCSSEQDLLECPETQTYNSEQNSARQILLLFNSLSKTEQVKLLSQLMTENNHNLNADIPLASNRVSLSPDNLRFKDGYFCPHCGGTTIVKRGLTGSGKQRYLCRDCKRSFTATTKTTLDYTKKDLSVWLKYMECLSHQFSIRKSARICKLSIPTSFNWRHKLLDVLKVNRAMDKEKLNGIIEADETYFHLSFKGNRKLELFTDREPHRRGNSIKKRGLSKEQVCVPCALSTWGKALCQVGKLGSGNLSALTHIFGNRIEPGAVLCSDHLSAYVRFCHRFHLIHNSSGLKHVAKLLSVHSPNIQHINAYHSCIKRFIRSFNGVATKYLNNYLIWFNDHREKHYQFENFVLDRVFEVEHWIKRDWISERNPVPVVA